jgi:hypothetical protein
MINEHNIVLAKNSLEHHHMLEALDRIEGKLEPIIATAIRGESHMTNDKLHGDK